MKQPLPLTYWGRLSVVTDRALLGKDRKGVLVTEADSYRLEEVVGAGSQNEPVKAFLHIKKVGKFTILPDRFQAYYVQSDDPIPAVLQGRFSSVDQVVKATEKLFG